MGRHSKATDPKRNARLAWLSQNIIKGRTDASIILEMMQLFPPVSEKTCREELKELYKRYGEINEENLPEQKHKFLELGFAYMEEMRNGFQYGPLANLFKTMATIQGVLTDKVKLDHTITEAGPKPDVVRDRISTLINDPKIIARAKKLGLDLDDIDTESRD
jgi:hypothetical protein